MAADESTVDRIIAETLSRHGGDAGEDPDVWEAQNELYDKRTYDPALAGDENYVIAERYMLSRAMVASGQVPIEQMLAQVETSAGPPAQPAMGAGGKPMTALAVRKVAQGAWDGETQRLRNGRPKPDINPRTFAISNALDQTLKPYATSGVTRAAARPACAKPVWRH